MTWRVGVVGRAFFNPFSWRFFFFQAEDGIRDVAVTGVQTCALPILDRADAGPLLRGGVHHRVPRRRDLYAQDLPRARGVPRTAHGPPPVTAVRRRAVTWRLPLVFVCSLVYLASGIRVGPRGDSPPFDIDEAHKLSESYYYHLFFEQGAWRHADWQADFYARTNPPLAKYVFRAALAAARPHLHDRRLQDD